MEKGDRVEAQMEQPLLDQAVEDEMKVLCIPARIMWRDLMSNSWIGQRRKIETSFQSSIAWTKCYTLQWSCGGYGGGDQAEGIMEAPTLLTAHLLDSGGTFDD